MHLCEIGGKGNFKYLLVMGFKPNGRVDSQHFLNHFKGKAGISAQLMEPSLIAGYEHVLTASLLASKSWALGRNISRSPATEVLLYASAKRQIKDAIGTLGVKEGALGWIIIAVSADRAILSNAIEEFMKYGTEDEFLLDMTDEKLPGLLKKFSIANDEISIAQKLLGSMEAALKSLVIEQVSLSDLYR